MCHGNNNQLKIHSKWVATYKKTNIGRKEERKKGRKRQRKKVRNIKRKKERKKERAIKLN